MGTFNGTAGGDIITPTFVSKGVGGGRPSQRADVLIGNGGDDTLNGGTGGDSLSGGDGNDLMIYQALAATDSATISGGLGSDTLLVDGTSAGTGGWTFSVVEAAGGRALASGGRTGQSFVLDVAGVETLQLTGSALGDQLVVADQTLSVRQVVADLGAGDDTAQVAAMATPSRIDGGLGNDTLTSGGRDDILRGGDGNDRIESSGIAADLFGDAGNDVIRVTNQFQIASAGDGADSLTAVGLNSAVTLRGDAGDDAMTYDIGLGTAHNILFDGGAGFDTLDAVPRSGLIPNGLQGWQGSIAKNNGEPGANVQLSHNGVFTSFTALNLESVRLAGGAREDVFFLNDLTGTGVTFVSVDLGAGREDDLHDVAVIEGTNGRDVINIANLNGPDDVAVTGLAATVVVRNIDASSFPSDVRDDVIIRTEDGNDFIDMTNFNSDQGVFVNAGAGSDTIIAGFGPAVFIYNRTGHADVIVGFKPGDANSMRIDVSDLPDNSLAEAIANRHIFQQGPNVIIDDTQGSFIQVLNVSLSAMNAGDFIFF